MLAKWVRAHDPDKDTAKKRLEKMPMAKTAHGSRVPFPYADKAAYKDKFSNQEINHAIQSAPTRKVPLSKLHAIQHSVKPDRVKEYIDHPDAVPEGQKHPTARTPTDLPIVVHSGGADYIHDGHHRATAELLMGARSIEARYVDLDALEKV